MAPLSTGSRILLVGSVAAATVFGVFMIPQRIGLDVVDVIPPLYWDADRTVHPEPSIAVNPMHPEMIAVSAYLVGNEMGGPGYCGPLAAGVLLSFDGGESWQMNCPLSKADTETVADAALDFAGDGAVLTSFLAPAHRGHVARLEQWNGFTTSSAIVFNNPTDDVDQPFLVARPVKNSEVFAVGTYHDLADCEGSAVIWWWNGFGQNSSTCIANRPDSYVYTVRTAYASDGAIYGLYYSLRLGNQLSMSSLVDPRSDLVLVRGRSPKPLQTTEPFAELMDVQLLDPDIAKNDPCSTPDQALGQRLKNCARVPVDDWVTSRQKGCGPGLGSQVRNPNQIALAVDPGDSHTVFYVYGDSTRGSMMTLHLNEWSDATGSQQIRSLRVVENAINPAVVVTRSGRIGFAYQRLIGQYWQTQLQVSSRDRTTWEYVPLSGLAADGEPPAICSLSSPYLGDYMDITSVGDTIYGVFSFDNNPAANPNARYLRNKALLGPAPNEFGIDPFFYKVTFDRPLWAIVGKRFSQGWARSVERLKALLEIRAGAPSLPPVGPPPPSRGPGAR